MGKIKVLSPQASMKIAKNDSQVSTKKQLNNLIKVLRPKVYITDSSNFKRLVQELTGNGNSISSPSSSSPSPSLSPPLSSSSISLPHIVPYHHEEVPMIDIEDEAYQESSLELSGDSTSNASIPTSFNPFDHQESSPELFISEPSNFNMFLESSSTYSSFSHLVDFAHQYGQIESWLLETDPVSNFDNSSNFAHEGFAQMMIHQPEVSVFDYDYPALYHQII